METPMEVICGEASCCHKSCLAQVGRCLTERKDLIAILHLIHVIIPQLNF